ncbi:hypothetical protein [Amycolatopsis lexingtonensis]|uniref:hypothetical protein n=1 Tax=Amycolatopsis lexingtonensis TaxID=218822 RepID=UPI003F700F65
MPSSAEVASSASWRVMVPGYSMSQGMPRTRTSLRAVFEVLMDPKVKPSAPPTVTSMDSFWESRKASALW